MSLAIVFSYFESYWITLVVRSLIAATVGSSFRGSLTENEKSKHSVLLIRKLSWKTSLYFCWPCLIFFSFSTLDTYVFDLSFLKIENSFWYKQTDASMSHSIAGRALSPRLFVYAPIGRTYTAEGHNIIKKKKKLLFIFLFKFTIKIHTLHTLKQQMRQRDMDAHGIRENAFELGTERGKPHRKNSKIYAPVLSCVTVETHRL